MCVLIKLHTTAQSGSVMLVILCHSHLSSVCVYVCASVFECVYVCVCVRVCVFIKLHITAQSGPVILVILYHSH